MSAPDTPGGPTLLIVDDNPDLLDMLTLALHTMGGFTIIRASDGASGLEKAIACQPDCAVIDVLMPGLNGVQLVRALRGDPATADIPLIILTAMAQEKDLFAGMAAGADHYLTKPATPQAIIAAVQHAISLTREERRQRLQHLAQGDVKVRTKGRRIRYADKQYRSKSACEETRCAQQSVPHGKRCSSRRRIRVRGGAAGINGRRYWC